MIAYLDESQTGQNLASHLRLADPGIHRFWRDRSAVDGVGRGKDRTRRFAGEIDPARRGVEWHAHRPHPGKEAKKYQVEQVREFLATLEIKP